MLNLVEIWIGFEKANEPLVEQCWGAIFLNKLSVLSTELWSSHKIKILGWIYKKSVWGCLAKLIASIF